MITCRLVPLIAAIALCVLAPGGMSAAAGAAGADPWIDGLLAAPGPAVAPGPSLRVLRQDFERIEKGRSELIEYRKIPDAAP